MAESLNMTMDDLKGEIGDKLGWGRGEPGGEEAYTDDKARQLTRLLNVALRWVYDSATLDPKMPPHQWSWLTPSCNIVISSGDRTTPLPDDFGGFVESHLIVSQDTGSVNARVPLVGESYIDQLYSNMNENSGRPVYAADRIRRQKGDTKSLTGELYVYPIPDAAYTFRGKYNLMGRALTAERPYPYGGPQMASCFIAACRAAAEIHEDGLRPGEGEEWMIFQRELASAIMKDGRRGPKTLGRNSDRSDPAKRFGGRRGWWSDGSIAFVDPVTVDDVLYD